MAFSRHGGFFASLQRVEGRLALEEPSPISDTMTASPLVFLDPAPAATAANSSGPALDFLTLTSRQYERTQEPPMEAMCGDEEDDDDDDIPRLMALLGLSPPRDVHGSSAGCECDCSGAGGFLGKVVGVGGPKCEREERRLDAWIHHFWRREPARLAHLLLAKVSSCHAFPVTVKEFLDRDAPPRGTD